MKHPGWRQLLAGVPWLRGAGRYPLPAYSEFMPPPRLGRKPCGDIDERLFAANDDYGWRVSEREEQNELRPGLEHLAASLLHIMQHLGRGDPAHRIARSDLRDNPFWPAELQQGGAPPHERFVLLTPVALARTQDDKGRVRWTLFGGSEQGPARPFWRGFFLDPAHERPDGEDFMARLLDSVHHESSTSTLRILDELRDAPAWARRYRFRDSLRGVRYVLTFQPFAALPAPLRAAYRAGDVHLLPFPGSLVFWGSQPYVNLAAEFPLAMQIPLLHSIHRRESPGGLRVPQSGWMHERTEAAPEPHPEHGPLRQHFQRTHRWSKVQRDKNEIDTLSPAGDKVAHVLFSTSEDDLGLYGKPMARNAQIWTDDHRLLLDGPRASVDELRAAYARVCAGGTFGYRFIYPPMQVGRHQVFWHRPLVAFPDERQVPRVMLDAPAGYLTAYDAERPRIDKAIELWPRILDRPGVRGASKSDLRLLDVAEITGKPVDQNFARHFSRRGKAPAETGPALTYQFTARRSFEKAYWQLIRRLAMGAFLNKDNADCVLDRVTQRRLHHHHRDLDRLADFLLRHYERLLAKNRLKGATAAVLPFRWKTDFPFAWSQGWLRNQSHGAIERDVVAMIPGRNRARVLIMADHYDTAYMEDVFGYAKGGGGPRLAARGADDNHSATAALLLAAPIFLEMSRQQLLECDVWLVHLTGEEFPSDCLGARALTERIVERSLNLERRGRSIDVSNVEIAGVFVLDMIAHNNDKHPGIFQIAPGEGRGAIALAEHAAAATRVWNALAPGWNRKARRRGRSKRSKDGSLPRTAEHPRLRGEVRLHADPDSTLYNTDAQIFSDAGLPAVLFMENYDIDRHGYHDSHDTMENIDLDFGSALAAIAIETVARVATE